MACHEQNKNKISPAELVKSREIKKVTEAEILQGGTILGDEIRLLIDKIIETDSTACKTGKSLKIDSLATTYNTEIRLIGNATENPKMLESQLLEAYQYNLENDLVLTHSIQKLDNKTVLYTYPIGRGTKFYEHCMDSLRRQNAEMWSLKIPIKIIINRL